MRRNSVPEVDLAPTDGLLPTGWATPGRGAGLWAGIAPWNMPSGIGRAAAVEAADRAAGWVPGFASALHRDTRAPVNLTPIGA